MKRITMKNHRSQLPAHLWSRFKQMTDYNPAKIVVFTKADGLRYATFEETEIYFTA